MEHNHQVRKRGGGRGRGGNTTNGHANHGNHQNNGNNATGFTNNNPRGRGAPQNTNARGRGRGTRGRGGPFVGGQVPEHANGHGQYQPQRARGAKRSRVNNKNRSPPSIEIIPDSSDEDNGSIHSYNSDKGEGYSDLEDSEPGEGGSDLIGVVRRSAGATVLRESRSATPPPSSTNTRWRELKHDLFMNDLPGISAPDVVNGVAPKRLETITSYITIYKTTICDKISELETYIDLLNQISAVDQQFWTTHSPFLVSLLRFHLGLLRKARDIQDIKSKYRYFVMGTLAVLKWDPKYTKLKRKLDQIRRKSTDQENLPSPTQIRALFDDQTDDFALSDNPATTRPTITTNGNVTTSSSASPMDIELPSALSPSSPPPFSTDLGKRRADSPPPQHVKVESRVQGSSCPFAPGYSAEQTQQRSKTIVIEGNTGATTFTSSSTTPIPTIASGSKSQAPLPTVTSSSTAAKGVSATSAAPTLVISTSLAKPPVTSAPFSQPTGMAPGFVTDGLLRILARLSAPDQGEASERTSRMVQAVIASAPMLGSSFATASYREATKSGAQAPALSGQTSTAASSGEATKAGTKAPAVSPLTPTSATQGATPLSTAPDWESNPIVADLLKRAIALGSGSGSGSGTSSPGPSATNSISALPRPDKAPTPGLAVSLASSTPILTTAPQVTPTVSAPNMNPSKVPQPVLSSTTSGISEASLSRPSATAAATSFKSVAFSVPGSSASLAGPTASVLAHSTGATTASMKETRSTGTSPAPASMLDSQHRPSPPATAPSQSNLSSPAAGMLLPVSGVHARERNDDRLRVLEKEVAWLLEYRAAPLTIDELEATSWTQKLTRLTSDMDNLLNRVEKSNKTTNKMSSLYEMLNKAFQIHSQVTAETAERAQNLRRDDRATWNQEIGHMREQALQQKLETERMQRQLEANARKEAEREAAQAGYQLKIEQMMTQMEAQMRRSAEDETIRCQNELQEQRIQTLEKDLSCRRAEAMAMSAKAKEEIKEAHSQVARAREERAEARELAARLELEKELLLKRIRALEAKESVRGGSATVAELPSPPTAPSGPVDPDSVPECPTAPPDQDSSGKDTSDEQVVLP